ncbi:MAG: hypothetical protein VX543_01555, partial [Cyanobacteriota bacterium]|nr:hypothetical protein [Cyanobacteriota bacterium]
MPSSIFVERLNSMGIHSLPLTVLLLAAVSQAAPLHSATDPLAPAREPINELAYRQVLLDGAIPELK